MKPKQPEPMWIVVEIQSGCPYSVEAYHDKDAAIRRAQRLWEPLNPDEDEVAVFELRTGWARRTPRAVGKPFYEPRDNLR